MDNYKLKIKDARQIKNISVSALAHRIGISQSFMSDLENQKYDMKLSMLLKISNELEICPYKLFSYCFYCRKKAGNIFFKRCGVITVGSQPHDLYNKLWGVRMNEKTTVYIEPDLKEEVKIRLIREKDNKSLSALINELLEKWLNGQK